MRVKKYASGVRSVLTIHTVAIDEIVMLEKCRQPAFTNTHCLDVNLNDQKTSHFYQGAQYESTIIFLSFEIYNVN